MGLSWRDLDPSNVVRNIETSIRNPIKHFNNATGTKLPSSVTIGGKKISTNIGTDALLKQARTSLREIKTADTNVRDAWQDAGKGEIGIWASGVGQSLYNISAAPINVVTGKSSFEKQSQKFLGGFQNMAGFGTEGYIGRKKEITSALRDKNFNKNTGNFGKNWAGTSEGTVTLNRDGTLSNENRVDMQQMLAKAGAIVIAILTGGAAASAYGGGGAGAGAGVGAVEVGGGSAIGSGGVVTSANIGVGTAAASGTPWYVTAGTGLVSSVGGGVATGLVKRGTDAATGGISNYIDDLIGGGSREPGSAPGSSIMPPMFSDPTGNAGSYGGDGVVSSEGISPVVMIGGALLLGFAVWKYS